MYVAHLSRCCWSLRYLSTVFTHVSSQHKLVTVCLLLYFLLTSYLHTLPNSHHFSSGCSLQFKNMKTKSLVIMDQHAAVSHVLTARHALEIEGIGRILYFLIKPIPRIRLYETYLGPHSMHVPKLLLHCWNVAGQIKDSHCTAHHDEGGQFPLYYTLHSWQGSNWSHHHASAAAVQCWH